MPHKDLIDLVPLALEIADGLKDHIHLGVFRGTPWERWQRTRDEFLQTLSDCQPADEAIRVWVELLRGASGALQLQAIEHAHDLLNLPPALVSRFQKTAENLATFLQAKTAPPPAPSRIIAEVNHTSTLLPDVCNQSARPTKDGTASPRLVIDLDSKTATLDGVKYPGLDPDCIRILHALHQAHPRTVTGDELRSQPGLKAKRIDRCCKRLPPTLQEIIRGGTGKGYWIELPSQPSP